MRRTNSVLREKRAKRQDADLLTVRARPGNPTQGLLNWRGLVFPCALGRGGIALLKREGDGATPLGAMRLLGGYFRKGRLSAPGRTRLPLAPIAHAFTQMNLAQRGSTASSQGNTVADEQLVDTLNLKR